MTSPDLTEANIDKLAELFPSVVTECLDAEGSPKKAIDFDLLRQELSDHIVEGPQERYQLDWPGKRAAAFAANAPIAKTLRPVREESIDFDTTKNLFIEGDNLDALKVLQESYLGKVKLIYIDPPYNTGNDFVYEDDFAESTQEYLTRSGQLNDAGVKLVANTEANGRFHSDWLSMIYPRLRLARTLMAEDAAIFASIGDSEHANLRRVMDEVFGEANFLASVTRVTKRSSNNGTHFSPAKDHVLVYARNAETLPGFSTPLSPEQIKGFNREDSVGKYKEIGLYQAALKHGGSIYPIECPDGSWVRPPGTVPWRWSEATFKAGLANNLITFKQTGTSPLLDVETGERSAWNIYTKLYLKDRLDDGMIPKDFIEDVQNNVAARELKSLGIPFDFPKPVELIVRLLGLSKSSDGIVLDFFGGSGSTAEAVYRLNAKDGGDRQFIVVQLPEPCDPKSDAAKAGYGTIADLCAERIRRAAQATREAAGLTTGRLDVGFRKFVVDTSNLADVLQTPDETAQGTLDSLGNSVKPGRTSEDLLIQVLLDWGLEVNIPISVEEIVGQEVFAVADDALLACFDEEVSADLVRALAKREPLRVVFRDSAFESDAARINAEQIFKELSPVTDVKAV
ncbi:site-specific DNA-methyltransferase [Rhodococcus sp. FH8]|uniref:site-specific DNA-methyltransferase n=1 Tax=Rhodococcus sp. FH8 TaxID=1761013 RepID=UPI001C4EFBB7|nr:site-specific DNA-methyltransferase [Rhodococcus sp. FH8]